MTILYHEVVNRTMASKSDVIRADQLPFGASPAKIVKDSKRGIHHISPRERQRPNGDPVYVRREPIEMQAFSPTLAEDNLIVNRKDLG